MIKLSILMVRRSDLTYEQFIQHWREVHGPLFAAQSESKQYVRLYIQNHRTGDALSGTTASNFDGIAEIWFDDVSGAKHSSNWIAAGRTYAEATTPNQGPHHVRSAVGAHPARLSCHLGSWAFATE